jgi:hypothetical protein
MRRMMVGLLTVLSSALLAIGVLVGGPTTPAAAQPFEFKQVKLTEAHIKGFIGSQGDLAAIAEKLQKAGDKPDPGLQKELEQLAQRHGFKSFNELDDVAANISMVMAGLDPETGDYTDPIEAIRKEMEDIRKDDAIPEKDKKQMIAEMEEALKSTPPLQFKENIALVKKYQQEIDKAMQDPEPPKKQ